MTLFEGLDPSDTIVAISTPPGMGGIGVIRLSGPRAHEVGRKIFRSKSRKDSFPHRKMILGDMIDPETGDLIDEVFIVFMVAPYTYTREDMVEIQCHSGWVVLERILALIVKKGVRLAGPGEFTLRAYLHGRIDLTQAEGVAEVIQAQSEASLRMAEKQLHGKVREAIEALLSPIHKILMYMEADIDFSEDTGMDFSETWRSIWEKSRPEILKNIDHLMEGFTTCQMMREGIEVVILGRPNVGKSSLLNRFLGRNRAIVTEIPGTTRDFIEEGIRIRGIPFKIVDTAGIRSPKDPVERIGTEITWEKMRQADILMLIIDGTCPLTKEDYKLLEESEENKTILVINKCDLPLKTTRDVLRPYLDQKVPIIEVSAKTGEGWGNLEDALMNRGPLIGAIPTLSTLIPVNQRHYRLLKKAKTALEHLDEGLDKGTEEVFLAQDVWDAKHALEAIIGTSPRSDVLSEIFQNFCVGK